jgi:hypothetical protein
MEFNLNIKEKICVLMFDICALILIWVHVILDVSFSRRHGLRKNKLMPFTKLKTVYFENRYV